MNVLWTNDYKSKSAVLFSKNTSDGHRRAVCETLHIEKETVNEKYLGLPVYVGQAKGKNFSYLEDHIWNRIQGWKEKICPGLATRY